MAISTAVTTFEYSADNVSWTGVPITSYPDMGSAPSKLDTTDLSATVIKTNILGLQEVPDLTFEANYDETIYNTLKGLPITTNYYLRLKFGTADGVFTWRGNISAYANGGGVDEVRKMTIVTSASTAVTFASN